MSLVIYPAIDVREGGVVRLRQGNYAQETRYLPNPLELAATYAAQGATWLHLVDLDAARNGGYTLTPLLQQIVERTGLQVQTGGGVRAEDDVARMLDAGASRVVVGSVAVREPERVVAWINRFGPEKVVVALDTRRDDDGIWQLPVEGWTQASGCTLPALATRFSDAGLTHVLCTDVERDGMLAGPNVQLYAELVAAFPTLQVQASGGVRDLADVAALAGTGCAGMVLGKALLEG
ncbi:MAG: 1-(5-phosphoribosyl)-5-[(5-phosphoribosylamino)methylideneamino]imidazole-4-carboxamide isomerase, partial [Luteimonas sp.]